MAGNRNHTFRDFVLDQLAGLGRVEARPMFGGYGLYQAGRFFGILFKGKLYFKTDGNTRMLYESRGMEPFRPNAKQTLKNYYEVPEDIIDEADELAEWAKKAVQAG